MRTNSSHLLVFAKVLLSIPLKQSIKRLNRL